MRLRASIAGLMLAASVAGCSGSVGSTPSTTSQAIQQAALAACSTYTATLSAVTAYQRTRPLSASQIATVNQVRAELNPLCLAGTPAEGATTTIMNGLSRLLGVQTSIAGAR